MGRVVSPARASWQAPAGATLGFALAFAVVLFALPDRERPAGAPLPTHDLGTRGEYSAPLLVSPTSVTAVEAAEPVAAPGVRDDPTGETGSGERQQPSPLLGVLLWGTVTLPDGSPAPDAGVWTQDTGGDRLWVRTDARGRYTKGPLPPGLRRVVAGAMHYHDAEVELVLVAGQELLRQDFVLRPKQRVIVRVLTSSGEPTLEAVGSLGRYKAVPVATREDPGDTFTGIVGSLNNLFGIGSFWGWGQAGIPNMGDGMIGIVTLHEDGPAWMSFVVSHQVLAKQRIDPTTEEVTFVLDPEDFLALRCSARGRVVDAETGEPLAGAVHLGEHGFPMGRGHEVGADGLFSIEDSNPGELYLIVTAPERARVVRRVTLTPGEILEVGDVPLHAAVTLSGSVRRDTGEPLEAVVSCGRLDPSTGEVRWPPNVSYRSGPDGTFTIGKLEPAVYLVRCPGLRARPPQSSDPSMMSLPQRIDATSGAVEGLELVLYPTTVITLVADGVTDPWPVATARDTAGLAVRKVYPGRWGAETPLHLLPGSYTLEIEREGVLLEQRRLEVGEAPQRLELTFD